jgi:uncharacterized protein (TIGR03118 family)
MRNSKVFGAAVVCLGALGASDVAAIVSSKCFVQTNLVSSPNGPPAQFRDPNLINAWGLVTLGNGNFWTANNGTSTSTLYRSDGSPVLQGNSPVVISVPGAPTGIVRNTTPGFLIESDSRVAPSNLIFVTESGTILGFNPVVEPTSAVVAVDFSEFGSVFKGAALFPGPFGSRLYAADFVNGLVEVFDDTFELIDTFENDPTLPADFAPFNVATIGNSVFVTYAQQQPNSTDEAHGPGLGFINQFDTEGNLLRRVVSDGVLNAPWGMVRAPFGFGPFSGALLVGNFGDGTINAFDFVTGAFLGTLQRCNDGPVVIEGLWGLDFGKSPLLRQTLFFASGPNDEADGLAGTLRPTAP